MVKEKPLQKDQKFGLWTVVDFHHKVKHISYYWCRCECGILKSVNKYSLLQSKSSQCHECRAKNDSIRKLKINEITRNARIKKEKPPEKFFMFKSKMIKEKYGGKYYYFLKKHEKTKKDIILKGELYEYRCCVPHFRNEIGV